MDQTDKNILRFLQQFGRATNAKVAESVHLSEAPCWRRIKQLEEDGYITSYTALLDKQKLGYSFQAVVNLSVDAHTSEMLEQLKAKLCSLPEVLSLYSVTGEHDLIMIVLTKDIEDYRRFNSALGKFECIKKISTGVILERLKETSHLPL